MKTQTLAIATLILIALAAIPVYAADKAFKCGPDGSFTIVMFSDTQDDEDMDPRTTALMGQILDTEKPDMVVIGGDCISGGDCATVDEVKRAIANVAHPMETRRIPWAIVFGNHDQEHFPKTGLSKEAVLKIYESYPYNRNAGWAKGISGAGNKDILVAGTSGKPAFALWLIDSLEYAPQSIGGYRWIASDQVAWYYQTSKALENKYKRKIPGLMFLHIPLREFAELTTNGKFEGSRFENESASKVNSGLFAAILERDDVKGVFCGHDHVNNYVGEWMGVRLGFAGSAGFATYSLPADHPKVKQARGGRVFVIRESDPSKFETWMRFEDGSKGP